MLALAPAAAADPIVATPVTDKGVVRAAADGPGMLALIGEVSGIGVLGAERLTTLPGYGGIDGNQPELGLARIGLWGVHTRLPLAVLLRVDASEGGRVDLDDVTGDPLVTVDRFVDDASLWWRPAVWLQLIAGRQKVPFSRYRQLDVTLLQAGLPPFLVDRVTPDRRWGALLHGDLGALSYAAGVFEDLDSLELRATDDPSQDGRVALAFHTEWTPRAPIGTDHLPTPTGDPWFRTVRVSSGIGVLYRSRTGRGARLDLAASGQLKYRRLSALAEIIVSSDSGDTAASPVGEVGLLITDKIALFSRGDYEILDDRWSVGWGASFFATPDRRNKLTLYGWVRRETEPTGIRRDGVIVQVQAAL